MSRYLTIVCFLLLAGNGVFLFSNLWKAIHGQPEIAAFAGINFIGVACMYTAIAVLTIDFDN